MKRILVCMVSLCLMMMVNAQIVSKNELSVLKPGVKIGFVCDFSEAVIMGMDEEAFGKYETDWAIDKPTIVSNFMNGINNKLDGILVFGQLKDTDYTLKVSVKLVNTKGYMLCDVVIDDNAGKSIFEAKQVNGGKEPPFLPGTKLAKMKAWALLTGRALGGIIKSEYLGH